LINPSTWKKICKCYAKENMETFLYFNKL
jgi:hypothetical protein